MVKKQWKQADVIHPADAQRWEDKPDMADLDCAGKALLDHIADKNNPHGVTKEQVGLGNVLNEKQATKEEFNEFKNQTNEILNGGVVKKVRINNSLYLPDDSGIVDLTKPGTPSGGTSVIPGQLMWSGSLKPAPNARWNDMIIPLKSIAFPTLNFDSLVNGLRLTFDVYTFAHGKSGEPRLEELLPNSSALEDIVDFTTPPTTSSKVGMVRSSKSILLPKSKMNGVTTIAGVRLTPYAWSTTEKQWSIPTTLASRTESWTKPYISYSGSTLDTPKVTSLLGGGTNGFGNVPNPVYSDIAPDAFGVKWSYDKGTNQLTLQLSGCMYYCYCWNSGTTDYCYGHLLPIITGIYAD